MELRVDRIYSSYEHTVFFKFLAREQLRMPENKLCFLELWFSDNKISMLEGDLSHDKHIVEQLDMSGISCLIDKSKFAQSLPSGCSDERFFGNHSFDSLYAAIDQNLMELLDLNPIFVCSRKISQKVFRLNYPSQSEFRDIRRRCPEEALEGLRSSHNLQTTIIKYPTTNHL